MPVKQFDDRTHWDSWDAAHGTEGWSQPGWALPADPTHYISKGDPYWGQVLDKARHTYGDPHIRYDTDSAGQARHLVFGDGTKLPDDGTVIYHNGDTKQDWAQNEDGTTSLIGTDGKPGPGVPPAGYRKLDDQYVPINADGHQVAPLLGGVPNSDNGFYTDPSTGVLTPKNADGDYYTLGPEGQKSFFDKTGAPITEDRYTDAAAPRHPGPPDPGINTQQQQSGQGAEAIKKMHDELHGQYTKISDADEKFTEVLLNAHATNAAGRDKLNEIQQKIVGAVNEPTMQLDTAAGERAFLTFLRAETADVNDLVASGALAADDESKVAQATAALFACGGDGSDPDQPVPPPALAPAPAPSPAPDPGVPASGEVDAGDPDPGLGPAPQLPGPDMGLDPGAMGGADPFSSLSSGLPGALGGLGGLGSPLDGLSALGSNLGDEGGDRGHLSHSDDSGGAGKDDDDNKKSSDAATPAVTPTAAQPPAATPGGPDPQNGANVAGQPPAPLAAPAGASATVTLPDGSMGTARSAQVASAVRDYLAGTPVDAAYRQNGLQLPPPGTPITNPIDTNGLTCGDVAMFKDHYEPVLSSVKGYHNGQVVALGSVSSSPDFMGFFNPAAGAVTALPPAASGPSPAPAAVPPPPASDVPAPVGG
jgi:hypothetical protein